MRPSNEYLRKKFTEAFQKNEVFNSLTTDTSVIQQLADLYVQAYGAGFTDGLTSERNYRDQQEANRNTRHEMGG